MIDIKQYGWDNSLNEHFKEFAAQGLQPARICVEHKNMYRLYTSNGEVSGEVNGKLRYNASGKADYPAVGDWVAVALRDNEGKAVIHAVLPRKSVFCRKVAGKTATDQVVAANFDTVLIMMSLNNDFNLRRLERYIASL